jgi:hypothetical protein
MRTLYIVLIITVINLNVNAAFHEKPLNDAEVVSIADLCKNDIF